MNQPKVFRALLLGLPIGLIVTGVIAMFAYFAEFDMEENPRVPAASRQKPVTGAKLAHYREILTDDIGERNLATPQKLTSCGNFLESTMSVRNMGYEVQRDRLPLPGGDQFNITAVQEGKNPKQGVAVIAHFDTSLGDDGACTSSTSIAALLSLANAMVGKKTEGSLLFGGLAVGKSKPDATTTAPFVQLNRERGVVFSQVIVLESLAFSANSPRLTIQNTGSANSAKLLAAARKHLPFEIVEERSPGIHNVLCNEKNIPSITIKSADTPNKEELDAATTEKVVLAIEALILSLANTKS